MTCFEFFGLPGAGKTTVAREALRLLDGHGLPELNHLGDLERRSYVDRQPWGKLAFIFAQAANRRYAVAELLRLARSAGIHAGAAARYLLRVLRTLQLLESLGKGGFPAAILDQGVCQNLWSLLLRGRIAPAWRLRRTLELLYRGVAPVLFYFKADVQTAMERVAGRKVGRSRVDGLREEQVGSLLRRGSEVMSSLLEAYREAGGYRLVRIDASQPVEVSGRQVADLVLEVLRGGPPER